MKNSEPSEERTTEAEDEEQNVTENDRRRIELSE